MLSDFGGFPAGEPAEVHAIQLLEHLQSVIADCAMRGRRMRTRCFAHSMNGMSVPRPGEVLLDLTGIRHLAWKGGGQIVAGAGLSVWELDRHVRQFGWKLPVLNDGGAAAPSVGGFVAAGGIGENAVFYGGFWESVTAVTLVAAKGDLHRLTADDAAFPWLFGSMGTLGVVFDAALQLVPVTDKPGTAIADMAALPKQPASPWPPHLWLTLFVAQSDREPALARLQALSAEHPGAWAPRGIYEYYLPHRRFNPPLLLDQQADGVALGMWGDRLPDLSPYFALEADFQQLIEQAGFRRYFQSELIRTGRPLARYVGSDCAAHYQIVKQAFDPADLLNAFLR